MKGVLQGSIVESKVASLSTWKKMLETNRIFDIDFPQSDIC